MNKVEVLSPVELLLNHHESGLKGEELTKLSWKQVLE
jgi:hypothetical protein